MQNKERCIEACAHELHRLFSFDKEEKKKTENKRAAVHLIHVIVPTGRNIVSNDQTTATPTRICTRPLQHRDSRKCVNFVTKVVETCNFILMMSQLHLTQSK